MGSDSEDEELPQLDDTDDGDDDESMADDGLEYKATEQAAAESSVTERSPGVGETMQKTQLDVVDEAHRNEGTVNPETSASKSADGTKHSYVTRKTTVTEKRGVTKKTVVRTKTVVTKRRP
jgi:hypothetical protein